MQKGHILYTNLAWRMDRTNPHLIGVEAAIRALFQLPPPFSSLLSSSPSSTTAKPLSISRVRARAYPTAPTGVSFLRPSSGSLSTCRLGPQRKGGPGRQPAASGSASVGAVRRHPWVAFIDNRPMKKPGRCPGRRSLSVPSKDLGGGPLSHKPLRCHTAAAITATITATITGWPLFSSSHRRQGPSLEWMGKHNPKPLNAYWRPNQVSHPRLILRAWLRPKRYLQRTRPGSDATSVGLVGPASSTVLALGPTTRFYTVESGHHGRYTGWVGGKVAEVANGD
ncbi:uncharacterized protein BKCO1_640009 [Diplodia corticola]|uniref:Uncharacterized protein n=1 Tax=Diplodia corticola TaxID=236234 RepID=A0A1J9QMX7_9PEZI|nr:uncharacterized protein BKCO1_640009 [Diplodia corticola]OJD30238.1 hypothetical protein BKCO1_640009 [Diplodia corticola]